MERTKLRQPDILSFLETSEGFTDITFTRNHSVNVEIIRICFQLEKETGINYLNVYNVFWNICYNFIFSQKDIDLASHYSMDENIYKIMSEDTIELAWFNIDNAIPEVESNIGFYKPPHIPQKPPRQPLKLAFVYIIKANDIYKIGVTQNIKRRVHQLQNTSMAYTLEIILTIETTRAYQLEKELHVKFKNKNINKEWFSLNDKDLIYLQNNYDFISYIK